jgi:hypothetical protein
MHATLKGFSQEVDLVDTSTVKYFLVFDINGREERLPVPHETVEVLTRVLYGGSQTVKVSEVAVDDEPDLTTLAAPHVDIPDGAESYQAPEDEESYEEPMDEEEVPSL